MRTTPASSCRTVCTFPLWYNTENTRYPVCVAGLCHETATSVFAEATQRWSSVHYQDQQREEKGKWRQMRQHELQNVEQKNDTKGEKGWWVHPMQTSREKRTRKSHKITMKRLLPSFAFNKNIPTTKQFQCLSNTIKEKQNCWETVPLAFFTTNLSIETDLYNHTRAPVDLLILKSWLFAAYLLTWILCNTLKHWEVCVSKYLLAKITKLHGSDLGKRV